jgi:methyl-accepting chemotaxis protein
MIPAENLRRRQSSILWEITILLVVVFVAYGLLTYFVFRASENRLIDKSIEKLKQTEAENISSSYSYVMDLMTPTFIEKGMSAGTTELIASVGKKEAAPIQIYISGELGKIVDSGMLGMSKNLYIFESWPVTPEPFVFASSDASLVSKWEVPDYLSQAIQSGQSYIWMENGIPEMGLEGEYLMVVIQKNLPEFGLVTGFVGIKPMHDKVAAINDFYKEDKQTTNLILLLMVIGCILLITLITFIVLSYLIRTRITQPIDELSAAAEQVMDGDLDVHITIRSGEEFEQLKRAFKAMVEEWGKLLSRSLEEGGGEDRPES